MYVHLILFVFQIQTQFLEVRSNEEDVVRFFTSAQQCIASLIQSEESDIFGQERLYRVLDDHTRTLSTFLTVSRYDHDNRNVSNLLASLYGCFHNLLHEHEARQRSTDGTNNLTPPATLTGHPGRPRYSIAAEQISHCVSIGMTWQRIASCFGISRRTLYRHRQILGVGPLRYAALSNEDLDSIVTTILQNTPNAGEVYVLGSLRSRGLRVQRWRVRQSLHQLDPIGRWFRRRNTIRRRVYNVQAPNQLWYVDL